MEPYGAKAKAAGEDVRIIAANPEEHLDMITPGKLNGDKVANWLSANLFAARPSAGSTK